jgi:hypothetical protein
MLSFLSFGKRKTRKTRKAGKPRKGNRKPPSSLRRLAKKYKVKISIRKGRKRVYKKISVIRKEIKRKMRKAKKAKKARKSKKTRKVRRTRRRHGFGSFGLMGAPFSNKGDDGYGYNQKVIQLPETVAQTSSVVTAANNIQRPPGMVVSDLPPGGINGTYARFFNDQVPTVVPPNWNFMAQPDGSFVAPGGPFYGYKKPSG